MIFSFESQEHTCSGEAALSYEVTVQGARSAPVSVEFVSQSFRGPNAEDGLEDFRGKIVLDHSEAAALAVALLEVSSEPLGEAEWPVKKLRFGLAGKGSGSPPTELPPGYLAAIGAATQTLRTVLEATQDWTS